MRLSRGPRPPGRRDSSSAGTPQGLVGLRCRQAAGAMGQLVMDGGRAQGADGRAGRERARAIMHACNQVLLLKCWLRAPPYTQYSSAAGPRSLEVGPEPRVQLVHVHVQHALQGAVYRGTRRGRCRPAEISRGAGQGSRGQFSTCMWVAAVAAGAGAERTPPATPMQAERLLRRPASSPCPPPLWPSGCRC